MVSTYLCVPTTVRVVIPRVARIFSTVIEIATVMKALSVNPLHLLHFPLFQLQQLQNQSSIPVLLYWLLLLLFLN